MPVIARVSVVCVCGIERNILVLVSVSMSSTVCASNYTHKMFTYIYIRAKV